MEKSPPHDVILHHGSAEGVPTLYYASIMTDYTPLCMLKIELYYHKFAQKQQL